MGHDKNDVRFASVLPRLIAVGGIALAVTAAIVWGAVRLVHEGPAVDLVSGRWALAGVTECTPDNTVMQVSGIDVALFARNAQLDANIVWVARVRDELRMDMEPRGLNGSVFALGFRRITPDRLELVSAGFLVPPRLGSEESLERSEQFVQYGIASVGLRVQRCREAKT